MGNASMPLTNAMDTATAEMGAMRPLRHVAPTVRRWEAEGLSAQTMSNASWPLGNATETATAEMGAMRPLRHVETTVGEKTSDVPMGNASGPLTNATETATVEMGAMKIHLFVIEDVPKTQQEAKQPPL